MNDYNECESCRRRYYYARVMSHSGETYHEAWSIRECRYLIK